ncbi:MAG TPA: DUF423 domain-containing protein [Rhodanobacteraceae bacterium]|jgi:uncharacterized membrane protein YgdD (TMEM256/DUF423 family)|nr:DUF423 domain-containing protein [Rhodanobacteraceae bacterium]
MKLARVVIAIAALLGAAAVLLGAFGAHALRGSLDEHALAIWQTAVSYQFWHVLAAIAVALLARDGASTSLRVAAIAFVAGIVLFSGSLYALALGAPRAVGVVTPLGGVAFVVGWIALAVHAWRTGSP